MEEKIKTDKVIELMKEIERLEQIKDLEELKKYINELKKILKTIIK